MKNDRSIRTNISELLSLPGIPRWGTNQPVEVGQTTLVGEPLPSLPRRAASRLEVSPFMVASSSTREALLDPTMGRVLLMQPFLNHEVNDSSVGGSDPASSSAQRSRSPTYLTLFRGCPCSVMESQVQYKSSITWLLAGCLCSLEAMVIPAIIRFIKGCRGKIKKPLECPALSRKDNGFP